MYSQIEPSDLIETKKCYKIKESLQESLNICYNDSNSLLILWNKYQIFAYELCNLGEVSKSFVPEFLINQIIVSNNYLVCLDCGGNVHITSLKFKSSTQKKFKSGFQPKAQNILCLAEFTSDTALSLKTDSKSFYLRLHKINADFLVENETALKFKENHHPNQTTQENFLLRSQRITATNCETVKDYFHIKYEPSNETSIIFLSLDRMNIYTCLYDQRSTEEEISLVAVHTGSSQICDIKLFDAGILIGLKCGTIIKRQLKYSDSTQHIIHLNTALHKIIQFKDDLLYTDGLSLWRSENIFTKTDLKLRKLFVKQPKDFVKIKDRIICTTYTNIIYSFSIEDGNCYKNNEKSEEYCSAERLLKNSELLHKIMREVERNEELINKVNDESNFITALSLSKRPDVMEKIIQNNIIVYENYEEVLSDHPDIALTEELPSYFKPDTFLIIIIITANLMQQTLNEVLSNLLDNTKIHITLSTENKLLKTTSVKLTEPLKEIKLLLPLNDVHVYTEIIVNTKLVLNLPGCMDVKQSVWTVLYKNETVLQSEHFIKTPKDFKVTFLKESLEKIEELILKNVNNQHGTLFHCAEIPLSDANESSFYVKLPANFKEVLKKEDYYKKKFNKTKASFLHSNLSSEQFLKSKHKITFEIGTKKAKLEIQNDDFSSPLLKVTSGDMRIAFNMRNFLANLIYNDFKDCEPEHQFVNHTLYTTTENLRKAVKQSLISGSGSELQTLAEQFHKYVIGAFPI